MLIPKRKLGLNTLVVGKTASITASTGTASRLVARYWVPTVKRRMKPFWDSTLSRE